MKMIKKYSILLLSILVIFTLAACSNKPKRNTPVAYFDPLPPTLVAELRSGGVQIVQQGSRLQLILPTDKFFRLQTIQLKEEQADTMERIALYLKYFLKNHPTSTDITVSGYTDTVYNKVERQKLSRQYAEVVASYLWNQGFNQDQLRVTGYGSQHPVASITTPRGSSYNRRVVIQVNPRS
ncbi:MAG: hypothetical protein A3F17_03405 [Gammaproteobacteria bacterium RIFCSPHIGHO2_12_FULL_41_15]|nr:MAG: hypothetical protein A3F17_03405 [Gammaproteobacteria bacterium RIFCSPHIGHO2_12_FULL_41_15]